MAINIDLLPGYVGLKRTLKRVITGSVVVVVLVAGVLYLIYYRDQLRLQKLQTDLANIETFAKQTEAADSKKSQAESEAAPMKSFVTFIADASKTGPERAALLDVTRRYVYWNPARNVGAVVSLMDFSDGQNLVMKAAVPTPDDYARFLLGLRRGSTTEGGVLFEGMPTAQGVPGFPAKPTEPSQEVSFTPEPIVFPLNIESKGTLKFPVTVPVPAGDTATPATGGAPGMPGEPGMPPGAAPPPPP